MIRTGSGEPLDSLLQTIAIATTGMNTFVNVPLVGHLPPRSRTLRL